MDKPLLMLGLLCLACGIGLALWNTRRTRKTMDTLDKMLTAAMEGDFTETAFDESRLSALETKLAHYLSASTVSARNLAEEKGLTLTLRETDCTAVFDPRWTAEALGNLVDNAIKYTERGERDPLRHPLQAVHPY